MAENFERFAPATNNFDDVVIGVLLRKDNNGNLSTQQIWDDDVLMGEGGAICDKVTDFILALLDKLELTYKILN